MVMSEPSLDRDGLERAARAGDSTAMFKLGVMLVNTAPALSRQWFERAADAGIVPAMVNLGFLFSKTDPARGRQWYERAARAGDAYARGLVEGSNLDSGGYGVIFIADLAGNVIGPWFLTTSFGRMAMIFGDPVQLFDSLIYAKRNFSEPDRQVAVIRFDAASPAQVRKQLEAMRPTVPMNFVGEGDRHFGDLLVAIRQDNAA
jgi:TPR repeat protein